MRKGMNSLEKFTKKKKMCEIMMWLLFMISVMPVSSQIKKIKLNHAMKLYSDMDSEYCEDTESSKGLYSDLTYSGDIYFGTNTQRFLIKSLFDTRSNKNWAFKNSEEMEDQESQCYDKFQQYFPTNFGDRLDGFKKTSDLKTFYYRGVFGEAETYEFESEISEQHQLTVKLSVKMVLPPYDELRRFRAFASIGLGIKNKFIEQQMENSNIAFPTFSFWFGEGNNQYLTIGGSMPSSISSLREIQYFKVSLSEDDEFGIATDWELPVIGFIMERLSYQIELAVLDSVSQFIQLPQDIYKKFIEPILPSMENLTDENERNKSIVIKCSDKKLVPDLAISLRDFNGFVRTFQIPRETFVKQSTRKQIHIWNQNERLCDVFVMEQSIYEKANTVILGTLFMKDYVTIFNMTERTVGIVKAN